MKILIARLNHETNTFSPVPTTLESFAPTYGDAAYRNNKGMRTAMAAFIDLAEGLGATLITPLSATANPSGKVHAAAYDALTERIVSAAPGCDAILLDLHGAMVAENSADGEGDLLARIRAAAPGVPIGVALDLRGNITHKMVDHADVLVGFNTYPHVDMYETGPHAAPLLLALLQGGPKSQAAAQDLIRAVANRPVSDAVVEDTAPRIASLRVTPAAKEGLAAFRDKRPAAWIKQG